LNLLKALSILLEEQSVTKAAGKMGLSVPAMSRTLARVRKAAGDPILVRAGRKLVPTPRALELQGRVRHIIADAEDVLLATRQPVTNELERTFTLRTADGFAGVFAARLIQRMQAQAPKIMLRFVPQGDEDVAPLREGLIDLDIGPLGVLGPEIKTQLLYRDRFVGVVRQDHDLAHGKVTPGRFAAHRHISVSRRGLARGPIDEALAQQRLTRDVVLIVPAFYAAVVAAATSDLVAAVPRRIAAFITCCLPMHVFALPVPCAPLAIYQAWHPRLHEDPAHRWLRESVRGIACASRRAEQGR